MLVMQHFAPQMQRRCIQGAVSGCHGPWFSHAYSSSCRPAAARPRLRRAPSLIPMAAKGGKGKGQRSNSKPQKPKKRVSSSKGSSGKAYDDIARDLSYSMTSSWAEDVVKDRINLINHMLPLSPPLELLSSPSAYAAALVDTVNSPCFSRTGWCRGLSQQELHEYPVDCFRMSFDQEMYSPRNLVNPVQASMQHLETLMNLTNEDAVRYFLLFTKVAVQRGVLPVTRSDWCWDTYFSYAAQQLPQRLGPDDVEDKWGEQHVAALAHGRAPLRLTSTAVYGMDTRTGVGKECPESKQVGHQVLPGGEVSLSQLFTRQPQLFEEVGGVQRWQQLAADMPKWPVLGLEVTANMPLDVAQQLNN